MGVQVGNGEDNKRVCVAMIPSKVFPKDTSKTTEPRGSRTSYCKERSTKQVQRPKKDRDQITRAIEQYERAREQHEQENGKNEEVVRSTFTG